MEPICFHSTLQFLSKKRTKTTITHTHTHTQPEPAVFLCHKAAWAHKCNTYDQKSLFFFQEEYITGVNVGSDPHHQPLVFANGIILERHHCTFHPETGQNKPKYTL